MQCQQPTPSQHQFRKHCGSISESSRRTYRSAQTRYVSFCRGLQFPPLPASEQLLILFTAELSQTVAYSSMRVYLSAVRHFHLENGWGNPLKDIAQLDLLLRGAKRQKPLTRAQLVAMVRVSLAQAGVDYTRYAGHSFRTGAATTAVAKGMSESMIQTLRQWTSDSFKRYIRIPRSQLARSPNN